MITKIHAIDRHKRTSTISVINREGEEIDLIAHVSDLHEYIKKLGKEDAVIFEASNGTFYWADQIEATGAECYIINPYKFKIIKEIATSNSRLKEFRINKISLNRCIFQNKVN